MHTSYTLPFLCEVEISKVPCHLQLENGWSESWLENTSSVNKSGVYTCKFSRIKSCSIKRVQRRDFYGSVGFQDLQLAAPGATFKMSFPTWAVDDSLKDLYTDARTQGLGLGDPILQDERQVRRYLEKINQGNKTSSVLLFCGSAWDVLHRPIWPLLNKPHRTIRRRHFQAPKGSGSNPKHGRWAYCWTEHF